MLARIFGMGNPRWYVPVFQFIVNIVLSKLEENVLIDF
jgi:hypothetical protein